MLDWVLVLELVQQFSDDCCKKQGKNTHFEKNPSTVPLRVGPNCLQLYHRWHLKCPGTACSRSHMQPFLRQSRTSAQNKTALQFLVSWALKFAVCHLGAKSVCICVCVDQLFQLRAMFELYTVTKNPTFGMIHHCWEELFPLQFTENFASSELHLHYSACSS